MPFKKLHSHIQEKLESLEISTPTPFQKASIPVIKSGANLFCTAPIAAGKTTTLIVTTLQKLKCEEVGVAPRAIVLVENREKVLELNEIFLKYTRHTSLRVYACDDKLHIEVLTSEIFEGVDILIATPKTVCKLLLLEGLNMTQLKIFNIDDAEFLSKKMAYTDLMAITQSIYKCQYVLYSEKINPMLKRLETQFMEYSKTVAI
ncbi:DEAD/DEAH box helicase [Polaribacter sp. IC073]|uniref:DEAD/DEAH box helicase n=1 Tax=Polaribacter sp. IC073 TaxID=2508540 RepID=UPI0011BFAF41|nr:DEAD/DEAH box helicase [Polaribacter sp. IC073]TXD49251.1 DEAD/DEAH box helicase [Polaribacter sp. IC073]